MKRTDADIMQAIRDVALGDGYAIFEDWFDPDPVNAVIDRVLDDEAREKGLFSGGFRPDVTYEPEIQELLIDEDLLFIGQAVLADSPAFGSLGINVVPPGSTGMDAHIDYPYFSMKALPRHPFPSFCMQIIWYPKGVETEEQGATRVLPGTQRRPKHPELAKFKKRSIPILAKPGSVFIGHGALWHGVGPNISDIERPAVLASYVPYWVQPMLVPSVPKSYPEKLRTLFRADYGDRIGRDYSRSMAK